MNRPARTTPATRSALKRALLGPLLLLAATAVTATTTVAAAPPSHQIRPPGRQAAQQGEKANRPSRTTWRFQNVDIPGSYYAALEEVNEAGLAVGFYSMDPDGMTSYGFLWHNGRTEEIEYPDDPSAWIYMYGINNSAQVIGAVGWDASSKAAVYDAVRRRWSFLPDVTFEGTTYPWNQGLRMNDSGHAVGDACTIDASDNWVCVGWTWNGRSYTFTTLPGTTAPWTGPLALNNRGDVVGQTLDADGNIHAYLVRGRRVTSLDVPGASSTYVNDINDEGVALLAAVFGDPLGPSLTYAWRDGVFTVLPNAPGAANTYAYGLDNQGNFCGRWYGPEGDSHGFMAKIEHGGSNR